MESGDLHIRSFRLVFDLERRLHRIDRWRLPLPYGLPLRSLGYAAAALITVLGLSLLPIIGAALAIIPAPGRLVLLPTAVAYGLTRLRLDGRSAHRSAVAFALMHLRPRLVAGGRAATPPGAEVAFADLTVAPDAGGPRLRRGRVRGTAVALLRYPSSLEERRRALVVRQAGDDPLDPGIQISFDSTRRLEIR